MPQSRETYQKENLQIIVQVNPNNHWLTVQGEKEFAVMKLDGSNYRAIIADFKTHGVDVKEVREDKK